MFEAITYPSGCRQERRRPWPLADSYSGVLPK